MGVSGESNRLVAGPFSSRVQSYVIQMLFYLSGGITENESFQNSILFFLTSKGTVSLRDFQNVFSDGKSHRKLKLTINQVISH